MCQCELDYKIYICARERERELHKCFRTTVMQACPEYANKLQVTFEQPAAMTSLPT